MMHTTMNMPRDHYEDNAAWWQGVAALDFAHYWEAMERGDLESAIAWQQFAASASASARRDLDAAMGRNPEQ